MSSTSSAGWIGVDLDGTLAYLEPGNFNPFVVGPPILPMVHRVRRWLAEGREVRIFTARVCPSEDDSAHTIATAVRVIQVFCMEQFGTILQITCQKDRDMTELWDDRAVRVLRNVGLTCCDYKENLQVSQN
jgi:hypothetical protein